MTRYLIFVLAFVFARPALASELLNWPVEGKVTDVSVLTEMATDPRFDVSHCPQLLVLRPTPVRTPQAVEAVVFCIQNGASGRPWNSLAELIRLERGQTLRILNFDEPSATTPGKHRLHTTDAPCPHQPGVMDAMKRGPQGEIAEVSYYDCRIEVDRFEPLDRYGRATLYDHFDGPAIGGFYIRVGAEDFYPGISDDYGKGKIPLAQELTIDKLMKLVYERRLYTIEDVLSNLPHEMTHSNYVLMYRSQSLQSATPLAPRGIVYSPSARFVLTFNGGHGSAYGGNTLEMIQFDESRLRFDFYELAFPEDGTRPRISAANPAKCMGCHQSLSRAEVDLRPNWEPYNAWPGAFGSFSLTEGSFRYFSSNIEFMSKALPEDQEMISEQAHESEFVREYMKKTALKHPRYRYFKSPSLKAATRVTQSFGELNFLRVSRLILAEKVTFEKYKYMLWYYFSCYPPNSELFAAGLEWNRQQLLTSGSPYEKESYGKRAGHERMNTSRFLTLVFEPYMDTSDWSMDFRTLGRFSVNDERFGMPGFTSKAFFTAFTYVLKRSRPEVFTELSGLSCGELKSRLL